MAGERIVVSGLRDVARALKSLEGEAAKEFRGVMREAAKTVARDAARRVPRRSGRASRSYRPRAGQRGAAVAFGGPKAEYVPWLDFGGRVFRHGRTSKPITRPVVRGGRYLYPAIADNLESVQDDVVAGLEDILRRYGMGIT